MRARDGYLLVECIVSMALLSISMVFIQAGVQQAIIARGQAQDYTTARFVLERVTAEIELQPQFVEGTGEGAYTEDPRFTYSWEISRVTVPKPALPADLDEVQRQALEQYFTGYMPKLKVMVRWNRAGYAFEAIGETLFGTEKLWVPREERK